MNKKSLPADFVTGILVLCAIIITTLIVRREFFPSDSAPKEQIIENWEEIEFFGNRYDPEKPVQIIKFYDYECPWCKQTQPAVDAISETYFGTATIMYAHLPLDIHINAYQAAIAAECARNQNTFVPYHTLLFDRQEEIGSFSYIHLAEEAGVEDIPAFETCFENQETMLTVEAGLSLARELNVNIIPTFLINGTLVAGALSEEQLSRYIEEAFNN